MKTENSFDATEYTAITQEQRSAAATRSTLVSVVINIGLSVVQIIIGLASKSQGLVADGIHSLSDLVADFVVLIANHHSKKDADEEHPYGHHRFETAASFILGALLLVVGIGMLISSVGKFENPGAIPKVHITALWVALIALVSKEVLFHYMLRVATHVRSSMLVANAWHARSDAASSLVVGAGIIGNLMGCPILDPIAALIVGLMIAKMGAEFAWDAMSQLMDQAADQEESTSIKQTLIQTPGVLGVHDMRTRKMGDLVLVDVHLEIDADISVEQGHQIAVAARQRVLQHHQVLNVMTHVDPIRIAESASVN